MPRDTIHICSQCGFQSAQWHGQCPDCGEWNTLVEERAPAARTQRACGRAARGAADGTASAQVPAQPSRSRWARSERRRSARMSTGIGELDRVLGGGLVPGSLVLLGGSPGIGKSTLTNMVLGHLQQAGHRTLYVSGEESAEQVQAARRAAGRRRLAPPRSARRCTSRCSPRPTSTRCWTTLAAAGAAGVRDRLGADAARRGAVRRARLGRTGPRGGRADHGAGQGTRRWR